MKTLSPMLMVLILVGAAPAQNPSTPSDPPDVTVLQKSWRSQVRNPKLDEDPFIPNYEYREAVRTQKENIRQTAITLRTIGVAVNNPPRTILREDAPAGLLITYIYSMKVRNTGAKTIRLLVWEYVFVDPATQKEVGSHQNSSKVKIRSGKTQDVSRRSASPPAQVIDASKADKELASRLLERVVIHRIEYTDGSVWQRPSN